MLSKVVVFLIPNQSRYPLVCACYQVLRSTNVVLPCSIMACVFSNPDPSFTESPRLVTHNQLQEFGLSLRCNSGCCIAGRRWTCQTDDDDDDDDYYHYMVLLLQHDPTSSNQNTSARMTRSVLRMGYAASHLHFPRRRKEYWCRGSAGLMVPLMQELIRSIFAAT
jgi:hypothetical protein